ncbi:MAG: AAA family ATPase [Leptolyngbya sp. PLA3]|nr:MAG: AAA family ATPase [Cyanobacteria bacterium CYA]MCE7969978.1 AAA family ATPase [Leptolyngbya sp. PL-A3]
MRVIVTGQIGLDKKRYLRAVQDFAGAQGESVSLFNVGDMMYAEAPDVRPGRILDLPLSRLNSLRRAAFKDVIAESRGMENIIVNTHATFRWRHGLFAAFDFDQIRKIEPDAFVCLLDNIEVTHHRLHTEHDIDATLKDCMVWREEEILATELMSQAIPGSRFYIVSRGRHQETTRTMFRLTCRPEMRKVYPSFPMSHVVDMPDVLAEIDQFRATLAEHFITFDPGDVDEKLLLDRALAAVKEGKDFFDHMPHQLGGVQTKMEPIRMRTREVLDIAGDIDGQIYMRDFKLIDQADMIVSYVPELPGKGGRTIPGLSSGVERELQHAWEHAKEVYVVWKPKKQPSPFITETATRVFESVNGALSFFEEEGMFTARNLFGQ